MKRVGRSVVSAITHTPASTPLPLETTPPISSALISPALCCADRHPANANIVITEKSRKPLRMLDSLNRARTRRAGPGRLVYTVFARRLHSCSNDPITGRVCDRLQRKTDLRTDPTRPYAGGCGTAARYTRTGKKLNWS